jgi:hypothetical protein
MLAPEIESTSIQSMLFTYLQVESEIKPCCLNQNGLCSKLITQYYCNLLELITHNYFNIKIIMSAILPRPIDFDSANSLKQQSASRNVSPFGHIILIPSQPIFALSHLAKYLTFLPFTLSFLL